MPSVNYTVDIALGRRVRVNSCEGEISIVEMLRDGQSWRSAGNPMVMTWEQARQLRDQLNKALEPKF